MELYRILPNCGALGSVRFGSVRFGSVRFGSVLGLWSPWSNRDIFGSFDSARCVCSALSLLWFD